jgi:hypothetical protein
VFSIGRVISAHLLQYIDSFFLSERKMEEKVSVTLEPNSSFPFIVELLWLQSLGCKVSFLTPLPVPFFLLSIMAELFKTCLWDFLQSAKIKDWPKKKKRDQ